MMNLSNEVIGVFLLVSIFCTALLIRYAFIWRVDIRRTQAQLMKIEEEFHQHSQRCPLRQQISKPISDITAERILPKYLKSRLLTSEEETRFRDTFTSLYPTMIHQLRTICPRVTRTDELLCMLIVLKQNNKEISYILGISRPSVLQNRYRLRCKLNLPEGIDLDAEIHRLFLGTESKQSL